MKLKYFNNVFVFECDYRHRHMPKDAGFLWHIENCSRRDCAGCKAGLSKVWFTDSDIIADKLFDYADDAAKAALSAVRDERTRILEHSHAQDFNIEIPAPAGLDYLPYQKAGIAFADTHSNALIGDEMGLGKTIQAIGLINLRPEIQTVLVVCPANLKINWKRELAKWLTRDMTIGVAEPRSITRSNIVIINYDILGKHREELRRHTWDLLVIDEGHYIKNPDSNRSREIYGGKVHGKMVTPIPASRRVVLTGTPIENRPEEIWALWHFLDKKSCPAHYEFMQTYYESEETEYFVRGGGGAKRKKKNFGTPRNLEDLQYRLRTSIMIRRKTDDVLKELPPKRRQIIELPNKDMGDLIQQEFEAYREYKAIQQAKANAKTLTSESSYRERISQLQNDENQSMANLANARKRLAVKKVPYVIEHVEDCLESTEKVILFAYHRDVIELLQSHFGNRSTHLYGGMTQGSKQENVDRFCNDPEIKVFIASIIAAGVGLNLTVSNHQVFAELDWVPGRIEQAEKRAHRIGQTRPVLIQHLHFEESLDCYMAKKIVEKIEHIEKALDKKPQLQGAVNHA